MPYVDAKDALNALAVDLREEAARRGPGPWRIPLVGDPGLRVVLIGWPPGSVTTPHHHPFAPEIFEVVVGTLGFRLDAHDEVQVEHGKLLLALPGQTHRLRVIGDRRLVILAAVGPNLDSPGETIEQPDYWSEPSGPAA